MNHPDDDFPESMMMAGKAAMSSARDMRPRILLTGGRGRLGIELLKIRGALHSPTRREMNISDPDCWMKWAKHNDFYKIDLIVHCAAYTDVVQAEIDRQECYDTNVSGTKYLAETGIPILYISTEYVFDGKQGDYQEHEPPCPTNFYSLTKLLGEFCLGYQSKILRFNLKGRPWKYQKAFTDQWTSGDYADVMAKEVDKAITLFPHLPRITHIGTGRKSVYELAKQTRDVEPMSIHDVDVRLPKDTSLDTRKWEQLKKEHGLT